MTQAYHDAMAIVRNFGKPDLFVTFTCNENWPEIIANLKPGQVPADRPDLIARVFQIYLTDLCLDLTKRHVLGRCISKIHVIEFQKRGKPHAHILLHLSDDDKLQTPDDVDSLISAEIPDPHAFPQLYDIVASCMMHGPCGVLKPNNVCMEDGSCTKEFPKDFSVHTLFSDGGYPKYKRHDNGRTVVKNGINLDNRWVVPYNPYLLLKYGAHINVEACVSVKSVKYLYKYVYKGHDSANMEIERDGIKQFRDCRYVCAPESAHHIFEYKMRGTTHTVERLPIHLPDMQSIFFKHGNEAEAVEEAFQRESKLTAWFKLNDSDGDARQYLYTEIPLHFCWANNKWKKRKRNCKVLTRLFHVSPRDMERYHLRILLLNVPGATCFEDLLTHNGVVYTTFHESCRQQGFIHGDFTWTQALQEACEVGLPYQLREMFSYMLINCDISDPLELWNTFRHHFIEDHIRSGLSDVLSEQKSLHHINTILQSNSKSLAHFNLPILNHSFPSTDVNYDIFDEIDKREEMGDSLTAEQWTAVEAITSHLQESINNFDHTTSKIFFVDGPGGSGKTYLYNYLIHHARSYEIKIIASALTGIAATLLIEGRTAHSSFKIPIPCFEDGVCRISPSSPYAEELRNCTIFIIDEASMLSLHAFNAIDRMLRDITGNDVPFGGRIVVFGGDFRQTLPVVKRATNTILIENCIVSSPLWPLVQRFRLTSNLRVNSGEDEFKEFLLNLGEGKIPARETQPFYECIRVPSSCVTEKNIVDDIFPQSEAGDHESLFHNRAILCPKNKDSIELNREVLHRIPGMERIYSSVDFIENCMDDEEAENYPVEFLNSITPSGMPSHNLFLKEGVIVMLLRNLNTKEGLTNGTRLIVRHMYGHFLDAEILTGCGKGRRVFITKMKLVPSDTDLPFTIGRIQFPIRLAYAMTINKSQGQSFDRVGICLNEPCFSHGQLYVAFSRAKSFKDVYVKVKPTAKQGKHGGHTYTKNIVLSQVLLS